MKRRREPAVPVTCPPLPRGPLLEALTASMRLGGDEALTALVVERFDEVRCLIDKDWLFSAKTILSKVRRQVLQQILDEEMARMRAELGAGPDAYLRMQRAETALRANEIFGKYGWEGGHK